MSNYWEGEDHSFEKLKKAQKTNEELLGRALEGSGFVMDESEKTMHKWCGPIEGRWTCQLCGFSTIWLGLEGKYCGDEPYKARPSEPSKVRSSQTSGDLPDDVKKKLREEMITALQKGSIIALPKSPSTVEIAANEAIVSWITLNRQLSEQLIHTFQMTSKVLLDKLIETAASCKTLEELTAEIAKARRALDLTIEIAKARRALDG